MGFGFGSPFTAIVMLLATSLISYGFYRWMSRGTRRIDTPTERERLRRYYVEQRDLARRLSREFDISDEEMEQRIEQALRKPRE